MEGVVTGLVAKCGEGRSMCCVRHGVRHLVRQTHDQKTNRRYSRICSKAQKRTTQSILRRARGEGYSNSHGPRTTERRTEVFHCHSASHSRILGSHATRTPDHSLTSINFHVHNVILRPTDSRSQPFPTVSLKRAIPCLFTSYTRFSDHSFLDVSK